MSDDLILAIDNGTQSVRAILFDLRGAPVASQRVPFEPYESPHPGWAEHDPEDYWVHLAEACRGVLGQPGIRRGAIRAVALTTQRGTVVNLDEAGRPLRPAIVWLDQRRALGLPPIGGAIGLAFRVLGVRETVAAFQADTEANWIAANEPAVWGRTAHYLMLSGFLVQRLTGRFVDSSASQVGYLPFDYRRFRWADPGDWKWRVMPSLDPRLLPELQPPGTILGEITASAAEMTGIPAGLPLVAAAADKACEVIGAGCLAPDVACLSYGTNATVNTTQRRYVEAIPLVPPYPAAIPDAWSLEIGIYRGYWMVEWFKRQFGLREVQLAAERGIAAESLFDELVDSVPAGSLGLTLQPFWSPGVRIPGPEAKGAIVGWGDVHGRAHLYRAILEGLAYALRDGAERSASRSHVPITSLRVAGGGSQSDAGLQLTADVFGLPASRPHTYEASGLGAAIDAAVGLGLHPSFEVAVAEMTRVGATREPDAERHAIYDDLYREVYRPLYGRLKPLYESIRRITGYPGS